MPDLTLPDWPAGTVCVLATSGAGGPHAIPVSTALRAADDRILLALASSRGSLQRLRADPRVALTVMAERDLAFTAYGVAWVRAEPLPGVEGVTGVEIRVDALATARAPDLRDRRRVSGGAGRTPRRGRATTSSERRCSTCRARLACRAVKLVTFLPPGRPSRSRGEVRGDEVVAFDDGSTVARPPRRAATAAPATGAAHPLDAVRCSPRTCRGRSSASA